VTASPESQNGDFVPPVAALPTDAQPLDTTAARSRAVLPNTFAAFQHRNFRLYWFGNLVSLVGTWIQNIATGWLVLQLSNSAFIVGLNSTLMWIPAWFVSLPAGVLADHFNKRNLIIATQSVLAVLALVLAILTWAHAITIWHLLLISLLSGFVVTLNGPVAQAMIPELVNRKDVLNAIALNSTMFNTARIVGPSIAGVLLGVVGPGGCFGLNAVSFLAIIVALFFIRLDPPRLRAAGESVWQRMTAGLRFVRGHKDIMTLIIMMAVFSSFGLVYLPLMPVLARDVFDAGARGYGVMMTCIGIGAVVGGLTLATISRTRHRGLILTFGTLMLSLLIVALSLAHSFLFALAMLVLIGFCQTTISSLTNTLIQVLSPDEVRGRVMSVFMLAFNGMFPVGSLLAGIVAQKLGAPAATFAGGCVVFASLVTVSFLRPELRRL